MIATIAAEGPRLGVRALCEALPVPRATYYRHRFPRYGPWPRRARPPRALAPEEKQHVLAQLHAPRFADCAPGQVYARLLDEGTYLCSARTMYRVLAEAGEVRDRRDQCQHPRYAAPELLATGANQLWSWDITKLRGPSTWTWFYLYVLLDVFSRYVVGWLLAGQPLYERDNGSFLLWLWARGRDRGVTTKYLEQCFDADKAALGNFILAFASTPEDMETGATLAPKLSREQFDAMAVVIDPQTLAARLKDRFGEEVTAAVDPALARSSDSNVVRLARRVFTFASAPPDAMPPKEDGESDSPGPLSEADDED